MYEAAERGYAGAKTKYAEAKTKFDEAESKCDEANSELKKLKGALGSDISCLVFKVFKAEEKAQDENVEKFEKELEKLVGGDTSVENLAEDYSQALETSDRAKSSCVEGTSSRLEDFTVMNQAFTDYSK